MVFHYPSDGVQIFKHGVHSVAPHLHQLLLPVLPAPLYLHSSLLPCEAFSLLFSWMTPVHPLDSLPIYPSSFNLRLTSSGASSVDEVRSHVTCPCDARVFSFLTFIVQLLFLNRVYLFQVLNRLYIHTVQRFSKDVQRKVLGALLFHFAWLPTYLKKKHRKTPFNPFPEGLPWLRIHLHCRGCGSDRWSVN